MFIIENIKPLQLTYPIFVSVDNNNNSFVVSSYGIIGKYNSNNILINENTTAYDSYYGCVNDLNGNLYVCGEYYVMKFDNNLNFIKLIDSYYYNTSITANNTNIFFVNYYYGYLHKNDFNLNEIAYVSTGLYSFLVTNDILNNIVVLSTSNYGSFIGTSASCYDINLNLKYNFSPPAGFYFYWGVPDNKGGIWFLCSNNTLLKYSASSGNLLLTINTISLIYNSNTGQFPSLLANNSGDIYLYNGNDILEEYDNNGNLLYSYNLPSYFSPSLGASKIYGNNQINFIDRSNLLIATGIAGYIEFNANVSNSIYNQMSCFVCNNNHKRGMNYDKKSY